MQVIEGKPYTDIGGNGGDSGRVLLMNNHIRQSGIQDIDYQGWFDADNAGANNAGTSTFWHHENLLAPSMNVFNLMNGTESTLYAKDGRRLWHIVNCRHGNTFPASASGALSAVQNYLPYAQTYSKRITEHRANQSGTSRSTVGQLVMQNSVDACVYSSCFTNGIGTIYFDAVNGWCRVSEDYENYKIVVEYATNTVFGTEPTDSNSMMIVPGYDDESNPVVGTNLYGNIHWQRAAMIPFLRDGSDDFVRQDAANELALAVKNGGTMENFYRIAVPLDIPGPVRFRIRRVSCDHGFGADEASFILIDNVIASLPAMRAGLVAAGLFDDDKEGDEILGWELSQNVLPTLDDAMTVGRAQPVYYVNSVDGIACDTADFFVSAAMHYRWRYCDQEISEWKTVVLNPHEGFRSISPLEVPDRPDGVEYWDVEYWFESVVQTPHYSYVDYSGIGRQIDYSEACVVVSNRLDSAVALPSGGTDWFSRVYNNPEPTSVVSVECDTATLVADADYLTAKARLSVRLSQACDEDVAVTLTPSFEDGYSGNWADYVRFSIVESELSWLPDAKSPTVVIPAGSTESGTIYVFALRSDEHTVGTGHGFCLTPSGTGANNLMGRPRTLAISANAPRIVSPTATSEYYTTAGEELEVYVAVEDTYADMIDKTTGYQVRVKTSDANGWHTLDERFKASEEGGGLVGITTGNQPAVTYSSAGDFVSQIAVVSPISGKQSDPVSFTAHVVAPPPTATVTTLDECGNIYNEGDKATFQVALSEVNDTGSTIYVFLKAGNGATAAMFDGPLMFVVCDDTDLTKTKGLSIGMNQSTGRGVINLLDNPAAANGQVSFSVVLCSTEQYDSANVLGGFQSNNLTITVNNVAPTIRSVTPENPDAWMVAGGVASMPIIWQNLSDVEADLAAGITVRFEGCANAFVTNVTEATGGSFVPEFGSMVGAQTVTMTIEDKDGGILAYAYNYEVMPSKFLQTVAHGPCSGMVTSALSQRYEHATGRGEGRVYVYSGRATLSMASNFALTWNCLSALRVDLSGFGYKVGDVDNGWLDNGRDIALTSQGGAADTALNAADTVGYYRYDDVRDSFLYCWISHAIDDNGSMSDSVIGGTATPEILGRSNPVLSAALPSMVGDDGFYPLTTVEAVFSKEWLAADNLGDINQDGVPDVFAIMTWSSGGSLLAASATGGETLANDLVNIGDLNPDESYLPRTSYGDFTNEVPFTVRLQLRGMGYGLNDAGMDVSERVYAIPMTNTLGEVSWGWSNACSLNELEFYAWRTYAEANGLDWTDPSNWTAWSPERQTDPTVSDTDGDGMPDGFEYRYWYLAHVGYFEMNADGQKVFRQLEGCRFAPEDPLGFRVIPAQDIAALMDPLTPTEEDATTRDSDNDGVADIAEIQAGQNPFDFHDAIHLPYFEIGDGVLLSVYMGGENSAVIPNTVTRIANYAFYGCSGLTSVTIPDSVTSIGDWAFEDCSGLTNVIFMGNAPTMDGSLFFGVASECCVYVRRGSTGWGVDIPGTWQGMRIEYLDVVEANGEAVEFEMSADGKTRTATVAEGTTTEDIKVIVGGVDVTKGFKVEVVGTTATVALKNPFEMPREEVGSGNVDNSAWTDNGDGNVTLNVEVVPGLYYAADSAATIEALRRPGAAEPAKAGDAVVAPKQEGAQGFYKVWVSDAPMEAE